MRGMTGDKADDTSPSVYDDKMLRELVHAREAQLGRRCEAQLANALRARLQSIDLEIADIDDRIRHHCLITRSLLPQGVMRSRTPPAPPHRIAATVLDAYLRQLVLREKQLRTALELGEIERAARLTASIRNCRDAIRKHCHEAELPVPEQALERD
ncbi:MAG TPA: hypothetical protein VFT98_18230 [Myxococcota bacterium]|nr:hypothetical protein [Myxococcota bacterium]